MDEILEELVPIMKKEFPRRAPTNENLYNYYTGRVRRNLHVVLCFSPVSYHFHIGQRLCLFFGMIDSSLKTCWYAPGPFKSKF